MPEPQVSPAWASTYVGDLLCGRCQDATVHASTTVASYLSVPEPGAGPAVIALLSEEAVRLPIGIVLSASRLPEAGSTVTLGNGSIATEQGTWRPMRWWDPRPRLSAEAILAHGPELLGVVEQEAGSSFGLPLADALVLAKALAGGDTEAALGWIGLGPGLTPAGDDVVAGALAMLALCGSLDEHTKSTVDRCARARTTALSSALLAAAGRGQVIPQAAGVLSALAAGGPPDRLRSAAAALFGVGATSGHDLCAGMAGALVAPMPTCTSRSSGELATIPRRP
ncbi:MAG: DUF2877 domain-containing protein [Acidimicrobiales bacterium]